MLTFIAGYSVSLDRDEQHRDNIERQTDDGKNK